MTTPFHPDMIADQDDKFHEECGVFAVWGHKDAARFTALGLHALQHRGQEATGIISFDKDHFHAHRALGHVADTFGEGDVIEGLEGLAAIGHNRYSTSGETLLRNVQPLFADLAFGGFGLAHNGNLTNAYTLRKQLVERGALFQSTSDTEVIIHLMATALPNGVISRLIDALKQIQGAYSLVALADDMVIGVRDPSGVRPLVLGQVEGAYVLASETCALDIIGAEFVREVEPGEVISIDKEGLHSQKPFAPKPSKFCIFEHIYFARPDSIIEGSSVYEVRKQIGVELAKESPVEGDDVVIVPIPDSGVPSAIGYAQESGHPFELGIIRNHYVGRTFIEPTAQIRNLGVKMKHNANSSLLAGRRVVLVDDSIVRGTTSRKIVDMVRHAGAKEVHLRISSPPTKHSCFYGIDTPAEGSLIANKKNPDELAEMLGADSVAYVTIEGLYRATGETGRNDDQPQYCDACFSGDYPLELIDKNSTEAKGELSYLVAGKRPS